MCIYVCTSCLFCSFSCSSARLLSSSLRASRFLRSSRSASSCCIQMLKATHTRGIYHNLSYYSSHLLKCCLCIGWHIEETYFSHGFPFCLFFDLTKLFRTNLLKLKFLIISSHCKSAISKCSQVNFPHTNTCLLLLRRSPVLPLQPWLSWGQLPWLASFVHVLCAALRELLHLHLLAALHLQPYLQCSSRERDDVISEKHAL